MDRNQESLRLEHHVAVLFAASAASAISFCAFRWSPEKYFFGCLAALFGYIIWDLNQMMAEQQHQQEGLDPWGSTIARWQMIR